MATSALTSLDRLQRLLLALLVFGLVGTATELVLLGHVEDEAQLIPLAAIGISLALIAWHVILPSLASVRSLQLAMIVMIATGGTGVVFHYNSNLEFQLEVDPSLRGFDLFMHVLRAKSPPALAPGTMALLGLLGLASLYRHPLLTREELPDARVTRAT